ncbi:MAG: DUF4367 domain-containing protein [Candidatus Eremiobacteraeota bacterium]|nr:DUF4367 domain-containing protein [Candidatus Eremiobacteraeota bacterium]
MNHFETGDLRRLLDEPEAFGASEREHARTCAQCSKESARLAVDAAVAARYFSGNQMQPTVRRSRLATAGLAAAAVLAFALLLSPLGSYAKGFLTIFQPKQFTAIDIRTGDQHAFADLAQLDAFGTHRFVRVSPDKRVASLAQAQHAVDFALLKPGPVSAGVAGPARYEVSGPSEFDFTFSAAKARAFAGRSKKRMVQIPLNLDGTKLRVTIGPMVVARYGRWVKAERGPFVTVVQSRLPTIRSTGATLAELENYMLSTPGVSPQFAARIRALGDLSETLPIPYRPDKQTAQHVSVDGVTGLVVGDNTGLGAGVIWQKNGLLYGVAGTLSQDDALSIANGMH